MKRVKHFLLASCLFPTLLGAQEMASAYFLELTPDAQSFLGKKRSVPHRETIGFTTGNTSDSDAIFLYISRE